MIDRKLNINCTVRKRNGSQDSFNIDKILTGINKSAQRSEPKFSKLNDQEQDEFLTALEQLFFTYDVKNGDILETSFIETLVGSALGKISPSIQSTYREYNLWKSKYADSFCKIKSEVEEVYLRGDRSNANTNSTYVSTKRCIGYNIFNKEMYQMNFLTPQELKECRDGFIYIHDMAARNDTFNCMLFRMADVMSGGFEMGDMWYTEPKTIDVAFDVMLAITKTAAAQQYGGFTIPRIDTLLAKYAQKSYQKYMQEYFMFAPGSSMSLEAATKATDYAHYKVERDIQQGFQAMEYDLNTIGSSRGDYPFVAITFGLDTTEFGKLISKTICKVRANGQGKPGYKKIVAFPKLIFLYDENLHGKDKESYDVYIEAVKCQAKAMYPDMLSLTGEGYVPSIYKKYGKPISPMGCIKSDVKITYKFDGNVIESGIGDLWDRIASIIKPKVQPGLDARYLWIDSSSLDLQIYDTKVGFTKVNKLIHNYSIEWCKVTLSNDMFVECTFDHPFETENRGVVHAIDLTNDDIVVSRTNLNNSAFSAVHVKSVEVLDMIDYSYDVETESEHFEMNGIYSHNCRAFLSPWFERGGIKPADDDDEPVFEGRANIGAISLNLPMIYQKSKEENKDFYQILDYYLEMIRNLHQRTYEYLGKFKAGCNPLVFCQGGAYKGYLNPEDTIASVIKSWTASFGITALNELQMLYNGKTIDEDGQFALEVLTYINKKVEKFKALDGYLYAIYSTPAEALCGTQVKQFRKKYGIVKGVSDKEYFTNSTHCPVYSHITPFEKQDLEKRFWDLSNGGHIQYVRHNTDKNLGSFNTINERGMKMGFYQGHNLDKCYCEDCGHEELEMSICTKCGSKNITEVNRVCGYLGYSKIKGDTRMNDAKLAEIADRVSM